MAETALSPLASWERLNAKLMEIEDSASVQKIIEAEMAGQARPRFLDRMHMRFNKLRAQEERAAIGKGKNPWSNRS